MLAARCDWITWLGWNVRGGRDLGGPSVEAHCNGSESAPQHPSGPSEGPKHPEVGGKAKRIIETQALLPSQPTSTD